MIILVAVTLNIALGENGLIAKAKETRSKQEEQTIYEDIQGMMELNNNGEIEVDKTVDNVKAKYPGTELSGTTLTVPGKYGTYKYKITQSTIECVGKEEKGRTEIPEELEKYILGEELEGRYYEDIIDLSTYTLKEDPTKTNENIKIASIEDELLTWNIRYNRDVYQFKINGETGKTDKESLIKISTPEGNLGKYVKYKGIDWIVLYENEEEEKLELISAEALGEVTLGGSDFDSGKTSYNNVITTLTNACKDLTGITEGIRNVGGPAEDTTTAKVTLEDLKEKNFKLQTSEEATITELIKDLKQEDKNYLKDYTQMKTLGILVTDTPKNYWLASRFLDVYLKQINFRMRNIFSTTGSLTSSDVCYVSYSSTGGGHNSNAVRPVVSLNFGILDGKTGEGTRENPINLD